MNCVVSGVTRGDQVLRIDENIGVLVDVVDSDDVEVMDDQSRVGERGIWIAEIASVIANDHVAASVLPFFGVVKYLIEPAVESESSFADWARELQVFEALLEGRKLN